MKYVVSVLALVLILDMWGFVLWSGTGQVPQGEFYIGSITSHLLK